MGYKEMVIVLVAISQTANNWVLFVGNMYFQSGELPHLCPLSLFFIKRFVFFVLTWLVIFGFAY